MILHRKIGLGITHKKTNLEEAIPPYSTTNQKTLTLSAGVGGSVEPVDGSYDYDEGEVVPINATASVGYRFLRWLISGAENLASLTTVKMDLAKSAIAEFVARFTLTTSVSGNGTISPLGANVYDDGTTVDLTVTADPDNEIDRVEEDGTPITSPYQVVMDASKTVIAYFNALITAIQDVFGTTPITESGLNYWPDASGNNNKVQIKNTQVGYFAGDGWVKYVETSPQNHEIELTFTYTGVFSGAYPTLFAFGSFSYGIFLEYAIDGNVTFKPGAAGQITLFPLSDITINTKSTIKVVKSGNDFEIFLNGDSKATWSSTFVMSNNLIINGDEYSSPNPVTHWEGQIHHIKLTNTDTSDVVIEDYFQRSGGVETDNTGSGGNGTFQGGTVSEFWSVTSDVAYPALAAYGGEVYEKDTNPGDNNYYIYVIKAASGFITPTISGYTKIEEHEPNRVWDIKNVTYDGIQITGIETDATFDDIIVLEDSATIDITKTTTEISNLIISE